MKFVKTIAMALIVAMLACCFIACSDNDKDKDNDSNKVEKDTTPAPTGNVSEGLVEITVSFEIKDNTGKNIYREIDYKYKGFDSSILGVLRYYMEVKQNKFFSTYKDDPTIIEYIGNLGAKKGQYWAALRGNEFEKDGDSITVKNLIKPENEALLKTYLIDSVSQHILQDGEFFTIVLVGTPEAED